MTTVKHKTHPAKKESDDQDEKHSTRSTPVITQIIEIVEEEPQDTKPVKEARKEEKKEEIAEEMKEENEAKEAVAEEGVDSDKEESAEDSKDTNGSGVEVHMSHSERSEEEKDKETKEQKAAVEELFGQNEASVMPEIAIHTKSSKKTLIIWGALVCGVALAISLGLIFYNPVTKTSGSNKQASGGIVISPTTIPEPTPTTAPVKISKDDLTIQVLNGGGKAGAASKMKDALEKLGYSVKNTGNADDYSFKETEIHVKKKVEANLTELKSDLSTNYTVGTTSADLPDSSDYDVQVIVGKE